MRRFRDEIGGAGLEHRRRERQHRRHEHDRRPGDRPIRALDGDDAQHDQRPGGQQSGHRRRDDPGHEQHDHPGQDERAPRTPAVRAGRPGGGRAPAGRRRGRRDRSALARGPPRCPAAATHRLPPALARLLTEVVALSLDGRDDEIAVVGRACPRKTRSPMNGERGGMTTSARPTSRLKATAVRDGAAPEAVLARPASGRAGSGRPRSFRGVRTGSSRSLSSATTTIVADEQRHADEGELEEPERPSPGTRGAHRRRAGSRSSPSAPAATRHAPRRHSGISSLDGGDPEPRRGHDDDRQQRRDRRVDGDERRQRRRRSASSARAGGSGSPRPDRSAAGRPTP